MERISKESKVIAKGCYPLSLDGVRGHGIKVVKPDTTRYIILAVNITGSSQGAHC